MVVKWWGGDSGVVWSDSGEIGDIGEHVSMLINPFLFSLQHSYLKNISAFLQACKNHFYIQDLFTESDLYDVDNFKKVMQLLSKLSHTPEALSLGWV